MASSVFSETDCPSTLKFIRGFTNVRVMNRIRKGRVDWAERSRLTRVKVKAVLIQNKNTNRFYIIPLPRAWMGGYILLDFPVL